MTLKFDYNTEKMFRFSWASLRSLVIMINCDFIEKKNDRNS